MVSSTHLGPRQDFNYCQTVMCLLIGGGRLSDERTGLLFTIAAGPCQRSHSQSKSCGTHDHILLPQIQDFSDLLAQVLVFIYPRDRVVHLYPQTLDSFFVASYNLQGCGTGSFAQRLSLLPWEEPHRKHCYQQLLGCCLMCE
jgi:hypothetical protein